MLVLGWLIAAVLLQQPQQAAPPAANNPPANQAELLETRLPPYSAQVLAVDKSGMQVRVGEETRTIPLDQLLRSRFAGAETKPSTGLSLVQLSDGSQIPCRSITSDGKQVHLQLLDETKVSLTARQVGSCLLKTLDPALAKQWDTITQSRLSADALIVQRSPEALDKVEGVIGVITETSVKFQVDKQSIDVQRSKLAGWRYFAADVNNRPKLLAVVRDKNGCSWMVQSVTASWFDPTAKAELQLICGAAIGLPVATITDIDFSFGSMRFLADINPLERKVEPRLALAVKLPESDALFGPRRAEDRSASGAVRSATSGPGIEFMGAGSIVYRVPEDFKRLRGTIALTPDGPQFVSCTAKIQIEDKVVWEKVLSAPQESFPIDIEVQPSKRVSLTVQPDSKQPVGDLVTWQQLRFVK